MLRPQAFAPREQVRSLFRSRHDTSDPADSSSRAQYSEIRSFHTTGNSRCDFKSRNSNANRSRRYGVQQAEYDCVAEREVGDHQQRAIVPRPRAPPRDRVNAKSCRASDDDFETVAGTFVRWGHAAGVRKNGTIKKRPD